MSLIEYKVLTNLNIATLEEEINQYIKDGWVPCGKFTVKGWVPEHMLLNGRRYRAYQPICLYNKLNDSKSINDT
jgi:hypothetical protein